MGTLQTLWGKAEDTVKGGASDLLGYGQDVYNAVVLGQSTYGNEDIIDEAISAEEPSFEDDASVGDSLSAKKGTDVGIPIVYGTRRVGGILVYQETETDYGAGGAYSSGNINLYQCWALCEGTIQNVRIYCDDVELSASNYWRGNPNEQATKGKLKTDRLIQVNNSAHRNYGTSYGSDTGIDDPDAIVDNVRACGASWRASDSGATHKMKGIACEQISYRHHWKAEDVQSGYTGYAFGPAPEGADNTFNEDAKDIWSKGLPKLEFEVTGKQIKDNSGNLKVDADPAWILYDYLTNTRYGCSIPADEIDTTAFASASTICAVENSGTRKHSCNIVLEPRTSLISNVKRILATMNGRLHWVDGLYTLKIDNVWHGTASETFQFDITNIIGGISITAGSIGERLNQVTAKFINPAKKWKTDQITWPDKHSSNSSEVDTYDAFYLADNNMELKKDLNVTGVTDLNQARYLAKQACLRSRDALKVSFRATAEATKVVVGDHIRITHPTPGWGTQLTHLDVGSNNAGKLFVVRSMTLNVDGSCSFMCIEHNDAIYTWDTISVPAEAPNTNLPDATSVIAPTSMLMTTSNYQSLASSGTRIRVQLVWTSTDPFLANHDVEYKLGTETTWTQAGSTVSKSILIQDFATGTFDFRVRAKNSSGSVSAWHTITGQEVVSQLSIPEDVSNFSANVNSVEAQTVLVSWDPPVNTDLQSGGHVQICNQMEGTTGWDEAVPLAVVSGSTTSAVLPLMDGTYLAKWVGSEGVEAENHQESSLGAPFWKETDQTIVYHDTYAGTLSNLYIADNDGTKILKFISEGLMDDFPAFDSIFYAKFDEYGGSETDGTYVADAHDMGQAYNMKLTTKLVFTSNVSDGSEHIDAWGKSDSRPTWDDQPRKAGISTYIRTTLDDPASGLAEWTDFKKFQITDVKARGLQLKVGFSSDEAGAEQFRMTGLSLLIDIPSQITGEYNKNSTSITYQQNFHAVPNLVIMPKNMVSGDYFTVSSETNLGFNVNFFNSSGGAVTRNYNYIAQGVG